MENGQKDVPSVEVVEKWVQRDLEAAVYALRMVLKYPDILEKIAAELHRKALMDLDNNPSGDASAGS